jgi:hypothetical protein
MEGGVSAGKTVTVKVQDAVLLLASRDVHRTVVRPTGKADPEAGLQVTAGAGSQRLVDNTENETTFEHWPAAATVTIFVGQKMAGGLVSVHPAHAKRALNDRNETRIIGRTQNHLSNLELFRHQELNLHAEIL